MSFHENTISMKKFTHFSDMVFRLCWPRSLVLGNILLMVTSLMSMGQPLATASNNGPVCVGSDIILTGGPDLMVTYSWVGPNGYTSDQQSPTIPSATLDMGGVYILTVTDNNSEKDEASTTVNINAIPATPVVTVVDNCNGTSTLSTGASGTLLWSTLESTPAITVSTSGDYTVTTTVDGCTSIPGSGTASPKTIPATPVVTVVDNCNGTSTLSTGASGTLLWSTLETTPTITVSTSGEYTVTTTVDGCTSIPGSGTASPKTIPATPVVTVVDNCNGTSTLSTGASGTLLWSTLEFTPTITVSTSGEYTVTTTVDGCTSIPGSGTASPKTIPIVNAGTDGSILHGTNTTLQGLVTGEGTFSYL